MVMECVAELRILVLMVREGVELYEFSGEAILKTMLVSLSS